MKTALRPFAAVGRMAFTNYFSQSIIFCVIFFGHGLGLSGRKAEGRESKFYDATNRLSRPLPLMPPKLRYRRTLE